jgi:hypothetical protein
MPPEPIRAPIQRMSRSHAPIAFAFDPMATAPPDQPSHAAITASARRIAACCTAECTLLDTIRGRS